MNYSVEDIASKAEFFVKDKDFTDDTNTIAGLCYDAFRNAGISNFTVPVKEEIAIKNRVIFLGNEIVSIDRVAINGQPTERVTNAARLNGGSYKYSYRQGDSKIYTNTLQGIATIYGGVMERDEDGKLLIPELADQMVVKYIIWQYKLSKIYLETIRERANLAMFQWMQTDFENEVGRLRGSINTGNGDTVRRNIRIMGGAR